MPYTGAGGSVSPACGRQTQICDRSLAMLEQQRLEFEEQLKRVVEELSDANISAGLTRVSKGLPLPGVSESLPPGIDLSYPLPQAPTDAFHINFRKELAAARRTVDGTMDAAADSRFRPVFEQFGWRTVIYCQIGALHEVLPGQPPDAQDNPSYGFSGLAALHAPEPNAFDPRDFTRLCFSLALPATALMLRLATTISGNRARRFKNLFPAALFVVDTQSVYEANRLAAEWFGIQPDSTAPTPLAEALPENLRSWLEQAAVSGAEQPDQQQTVEQMWLTLRDGRRIWAGARVLPYRPLEYLDLPPGTITGFKNLSVTDVMTRLRVLILRDQTAEWESARLQQEMELARRMQASLLPARLPAYPGLELAAACIPAGHVGGDIYDAVGLRDGRLALFLCDAAGHGVDSGFLATLVSGAFRATVPRCPDPRDLLGAMDESVRVINQPGFVTAAYLLFERQARSVSIGLAGHPAPLFYRANRGRCESLLVPSTPLGVQLPPVYHVERFQLAAGDIVGIFSDGVLDLSSGSGDHFDTKLPDVLAEHASAPAAEILDAVLDAARDFLGGSPQEDDVTLIIARAE